MTNPSTKTMILAFLLLGLFSLNAHASGCNYISGSRSVDIFILLPNEIEVSPTLPIGSIIKNLLDRFQEAIIAVLSSVNQSKSNINGKIISIIQ